MRDLWLKVSNFDNELITTAIESGIKDFLVSNIEIGNKIKKLGKINIIDENKDIILYKYKNRDDEDKIVNLSKEKKVILTSESWEIIPWENLIAKGAKFYVFVANIDDLKSATGVLEKGVYGIIFNTQKSDILRKLILEINKEREKINLSPAKVTNIKVLSSGERVCIDTCNIMTIGEGMLIGSSSNFLFLVHSESIENPYCAPRPFRVNAGAVYAYVKTDIDNTKYLSEIKSGDDILIVNYQGSIKKGIVGRSKIETRPLILIEAELDKKVFSVILQNAETINLVSPDGHPISISKLAVGDKVLVHADKGGRHFGKKIEENIIEK